MENTDAVPPQDEIKKETLYISEVAKPVEVTSGRTVPFLDWLKKLAANLKEKGITSDASILEDKNTNGELVYILMINPDEQYGNLRTEADAHIKTTQDFLKEGEKPTPYFRREPKPAMPLQTAKPVWKLNTSSGVLSPASKS